MRRQPEVPITLLEASDNFFAYEPVLKALHASSEATMPMQDLLQVNSSGQVGLDVIVSVNVNVWCSAEPIVAYYECFSSCDVVTR